MTSEEILKEYNALPSEARKEVENFVALLRLRYGKKKPHAAKIDLSEEGFIGLWKDREDISEGSIWIRKLRESEWVK